MINRYNLLYNIIDFDFLKKYENIKPEPTTMRYCLGCVKIRNRNEFLLPKYRVETDLSGYNTVTVIPNKDNADSKIPLSLAIKRLVKANENNKIPIELYPIPIFEDKNEYISFLQKGYTVNGDYFIRSLDPKRYILDRAFIGALHGVSDYKNAYDYNKSFYYSPPNNLEILKIADKIIQRIKYNK